MEHLGGLLLNLFHCRVEIRVHLGERLVQLHQGVEGTHLEPGFVNLRGEEGGLGRRKRRAYFDIVDFPVVLGAGADAIASHHSLHLFFVLVCQVGSHNVEHHIIRYF